MLTHIWVASLLIGSSALPAVAAGCSVSPFNFVFGADTATTMVTKSGGRCSGHINGRSAISGSTVSQPPSHGTAMMEGHHFLYQSQPGYTGPDAFSIALTDTSYRKGRSSTYAIDGTTHVNFSVQVVR